VNICKLSFFYLMIWVCFPFVHLTAHFFFNYLFFIIFLWFKKNFFLSILMVIISLELTRVNPDRNIFSINVELISTFFTLYRGLVHLHHHWILNHLINLQPSLWLLFTVLMIHPMKSNCKKRRKILVKFLLFFTCCARSKDTSARSHIFPLS